MLDDVFNVSYTDYVVYSVTSIKNKYGFRIKLIFEDGSFKIIQKSGYKLKREAVLARDNAVYELSSRKFIFYQDIKLKDFLNKWLENVFRPNVTYNSYMAYRNIIKNHINTYMGEIYLTNIKIDNIQDFYNHVIEKSSESILRLAKVVLKSSFEYAEEKSLIKKNIIPLVKLPKGVKEKHFNYLEIDFDKALSIDQVKLLIEKSKETPIYMQVLFAVLMGLRRSEINGLKFSDVDFVNRKLYVRRQLGVDPKKSKEDCTKKTYTKQEIKLKTKNSERVLDIPDMVYEAILEARTKYEKNRNRRINDKNNPFQDDGFICCSTYGHSRSKGFHQQYFKKLLKDNNLPDICFHELRHTYTTLLLTNNFNVKAVSKNLGHASTIITNSVYFDKTKIVIDCSNELNKYYSDFKSYLEENENNNRKLIDFGEINIGLFV